MDEETGVPFDETMHASAVYFLSQEDKKSAAILLACTINLESDTSSWSGSAYTLQIRAPYEYYKMLTGEDNSIIEAIRGAFNAVLAGGDYINGIVILAPIMQVEPNWKAQMFEIIQGKSVYNQGVDIKDSVTIIWNNLKFRSQSEKKIAEALDRAGVMYFPNCLARLTTSEGRKNKEPDFLICHNSKWGILEVDGEPFHPASRTTEENKRDRDFYKYGLHKVFHYDAQECYYTPDKVVKDFLELLEK